MFQQPHICHLTILNPVRHPRIFYKQALSQAAWGFRVTVIGADGRMPDYHHLGIHCISNGGSPFAGWVSRSWMARQAIQSAASLRADVYVIHTPELIHGISQIRKTHPASRFVYDVHEDYQANLEASGIPRKWMASRVRQQEKDFIQQYCTGLQLAEFCYEGIFGSDIPTVTLPNTFVRCPEVDGISGRPSDKPFALYTGTLSREWGADQAERIAAKTGLPLIIAGSGRLPPAPSQGDRPISIGGTEYVPYPVIQWLQKHASVHLAPYRLHPRLAGKIPTKFYEALGWSKPILIPDHPPWIEFLGNHGISAGRPDIREAVEGWTAPTQMGSEHLWYDTALRMRNTWQGWFPDLF